MATFTGKTKSAGAAINVPSKDAAAWTNAPLSGVTPGGEFDVGVFDQSSFDVPLSQLTIVWSPQTKETA